MIDTPDDETQRSSPPTENPDLSTKRLEEGSEEPFINETHGSEVAIQTQNEAEQIAQSEPKKELPLTQQPENQTYDQSSEQQVYEHLPASPDPHEEKAPDGKKEQQKEVQRTEVERSVVPSTDPEMTLWDQKREEPDLGNPTIVESSLSPMDTSNQSVGQGFRFNLLDEESDKEIPGSEMDIASLFESLDASQKEHLLSLFPQNGTTSARDWDIDKAIDVLTQIANGTQAAPTPSGIPTGAIRNADGTITMSHFDYNQLPPEQKASITAFSSFTNENGVGCISYPAPMQTGVLPHDPQTVRNGEQTTARESDQIDLDQLQTLINHLKLCRNTQAVFHRLS